MASSSTLPSTEALTRPFEPIDVDFETSKLIAQLTLDDIAQITGARKGKARADAPLSDEEIAFRIQCEYLESAVRTIDDHRIAKSFNEAIETDHSYLNAISILEQAAADDHQAALALSNGGVLPQPSNAQRLLEDPTFATLLEPVTEPLKTPVEDNTSSTVVGDQPMDESSGQLSPSPNPVHSIKVFKATAIAQPTSSQRPRQSRAQCTSCGDLIRGPRALKGSCGHDYCGDCISDLVTACTRDDSLYPPRCCGEAFPYETLVRLLTSALRATFDVKRIELEVPAANRVFCPNPICSIFLGSSLNAKVDFRCSNCATSVCPQCRQTSHAGENCSENIATLAVKELARNEHWQTCPECKNIIELHTGCYHMTCRCRAQFCYLCAVPWKNCGCPHWEEARLLETAQHRVEMENMGRPQVAPLVFQERVRQMTNVLRDTHNCVRHVWRRQDGRARCEECRYVLRDYLLACRNCHLMACVRCARNRLA